MKIKLKNRNKVYCKNRERYSSVLWRKKRCLNVKPKIVSEKELEERFYKKFIEELKHNAILLSPRTDFTKILENKNVFEKIETLKGFLKPKVVISIEETIRINLDKKYKGLNAV